MIWKISSVDSIKDVLNDYKYDYDQIISHWKRKGSVSMNESNSFVLLDRNEIYAIKFGTDLYLDTLFPYDKMERDCAFLPNVKTILDISRRDEKIQTIFNI